MRFKAKTELYSFPLPLACHYQQARTDMFYIGSPSDVVELSVYKCVDSSSFFIKGAVIITRFMIIRLEVSAQSVKITKFPSMIVMGLSCVA